MSLAQMTGYGVVCLASLVACVPRPRPKPTGALVVTIEGSAELVRSVPIDEPSPPDEVLRLDTHGIGELKVGAPFPPSLATDDLVKRYTTRFYADGQPLEGFTFANPPLIAYVSGGPYHELAASPGDPVPDHLGAEAVARARAGRLTITMLVITTPEVTTRTNIHVGSTYAEAVRAYPAARTMGLPGLWEDPSCLLEHENLTLFFPPPCAAAGATRIPPTAPIIRIVLGSGSDR